MESKVKRKQAPLSKLAWKRNSFLGRLALIKSHLRSLKTMENVMHKNEKETIEAMLILIENLTANKTKSWDKIKKKFLKNENKK